MILLHLLLETTPSLESFRIVLSYGALAQLTKT